MSAVDLTPIHRASCPVCEQETQFVAIDGEDPWCEQCGHNETSLNPPSQPGGCRDHPDSTHGYGFGLAGGGYGPYSVCDECGVIFDMVDVGDDA